MHELTTAVRAVELAIAGTSQPTSWPALLHHRLDGLRGAYIGYLQHSMGGTSAAVEDNPWLSARLLVLRRDQARVADEIDRLIDACTPSVDVDSLRHQILALLARVARTRQREVDLLYKSVDLELGGEQ